MSRAAEDTDRTLWVGDLSPEWDSAYIAEAFPRMGEEVTNAKVVFDEYSTKAEAAQVLTFCQKTGTLEWERIMQQAGYCFVAARRAMLHINGKIIPKPKPAAAFNLSFTNSPNAPYRSCRGAKVYRNSDGLSKGLGFVRFPDQTDQQRALLETNKYRVDGKQLLFEIGATKVPRTTTSTLTTASRL